MVRSPAIWIQSPHTGYLVVFTVKPARRFLQLLTPVCLGLVLCGCVSNKYKATSAVDAQPDWMHLELGGEPVHARLDTVIIYQGAGSWKKAAYWDEFIVTLENRTQKNITLTAANLVDYAGTTIPTGDDPWRLEKDSLSQRDRYTKAGVNFVLNTLGYAAATYGMVGVGAVVGATATNTWAGVTTGAVIGLVAVPVGAVVIYTNNQKHKHAIEREFTRRRLVLPLVLAPGKSRAGSFFFPMTVGPLALRLKWQMAGERGVIALPLPMLSGMHRK